MMDEDYEIWSEGYNEGRQSRDDEVRELEEQIAALKEQIKDLELQALLEKEAFWR